MDTVIMNLNEQQLLELRLEMEEIISQREGMIAENKQREFLGQGPAYWEDNFAINAEQFRFIRERLIILARRIAEIEKSFPPQR